MKKILKNLIAKYNITLISVGNGTASRESELVIVDLLKELSDNSIDLVVTSPPYDNMRSYGGVINQWDENKFKEIAKELDITEGGSRSQLSRARLWLQEKLYAMGIK